MSTPVLVDRWLSDRKDLITLKHVPDNGGYTVLLESTTAPKWITRDRFCPTILDAMYNISGVMERVGGTWTKV